MIAVKDPQMIAQSQQRLVDLGYTTLPVTAVIDSNWSQVISAFQTKENLEVNGALDTMTYLQIGKVWRERPTLGSYLILGTFVVGSIAAIGFGGYLVYKAERERREKSRARLPSRSYAELTVGGINLPNYR